MNKTRVLSTLAVLLMLPLTAFAQDAQERIDHARTRAMEVGIPLSLLDSKVAEGRAKGVDMDRIATAVENRLRNLERAKAVMSHALSDVDPGELSVGADAIAAGVGDAVLEQISTAPRRERRTVAIAALTQLVLHGTAPEVAVARVNEALAHGPQALANLAVQSGSGNGTGNSQGSNSGGANAPRNAGPQTSAPAGPPRVPATPPGVRGLGRGGH